MEDLVSIYKCLNCKNEFSLLFSLNEIGESINVEPCPICEASYDKIILLKENR